MVLDECLSQVSTAVSEGDRQGGESNSKIPADDKVAQESVEIKAEPAQLAQLLSCDVHVGIASDDAFDVESRVWRHCDDLINHTPDVLIHVRGRGCRQSKVCEEAHGTGPLRICISSYNESTMESVSGAVMKVVNNIHSEYAEFCKSVGKSARRLAPRKVAVPPMRSS